MSEIKYYFLVFNLCTLSTAIFENLTDTNLDDLYRKTDSMSPNLDFAPNSHTSIKLLGIKVSPLETKFSAANQGTDVVFCRTAQLPKFKFSADWTNCSNAPVKTRHHLDGKTTEDILKSYGYSTETHSVKTEDGYILTVFRIVKPSNKNKSGLPVYVNHGLAGSSDFWFFQPKERTIIAKLVESGFDVWISNARGTSYSLNHTNYNSTSDIKYWDFSYHEMAMYDVPAVTEHIIKNTSYKKILYVAYSMGTTQAFIALSEIPEMNQKIEAAFMLAPIAYMGHSTDAARILARVLHSYEAYKLINQHVKGRFSSSTDIKQQLGMSAADFCSYSAARCGMCDNFWFAYFGYNAPQMNRTELPNILARFPNIMSAKTISHYGQFINSCKFQKYNYGLVLNLEKYGTAVPPEYELGNIKSDLYFYYSSMDSFGVPLDVNKTAGKLSSGVLKEMYLVPDKWFNHLDFAIAKDADVLVYNKVVSDMKTYQ